MPTRYSPWPEKRLLVFRLSHGLTNLRVVQDHFTELDGAQNGVWETKEDNIPPSPEATGTGGTCVRGD